MCGTGPSTLKLCDPQQVLSAGSAQWCIASQRLYVLTKPQRGSIASIAVDPSALPPPRQIAWDTHPFLYPVEQHVWLQRALCICRGSYLDLLQNAGHNGNKFPLSLIFTWKTYIAALPALRGAGEKVLFFCERRSTPNYGCGTIVPKWLSRIFESSYALI